MTALTICVQWEKSLAPLLPSDRQSLQARIALAPTLTHQFWKVGVIDLQDNVTADLRGPPGSRIDIADGSYFQAAWQSRLPGASDPVSRTLSGKPVAGIIVSVLGADGQPVAFVAGGYAAFAAA